MSPSTAVPNEARVSTAARNSRVVWMYRVTAVLLVLFALGHTYGFLRFIPPTAEGIAVQRGMGSVTFPVGTATRSFAGFYDGFGFMVTAYLFFGAVIAWTLASFARRGIAESAPIAWAFFAVLVVSTALSFRYFFAAPAVLSSIAALLSGAAAWRGVREG